MMTVLLERRIGRTLTALMARFSAPEWNGARLEAWLFEDAPARRAAEVTLGHAGVQAKLRSAYKPLLHAVLEEIDLAGCDAVTLHLPTHELAAPRRFALETYPLAGLLGATPLHFANGDAPLEYSVAVMRAGATTTHRVFAPNRMRTDPTGQDCLGACGWLRVWRDGALVEDAPLKTEFEAAYDTVMATIAAHPWPAATPYFATLEIVVHIAGIERPLPWQDECLSTREALHEEFYFSLLEFFQRHANRPAGDRQLQPGHIIPDIRATDGDCLVRIELRPPVRAGEAPAAPIDLETIDRPLLFGEIAQALAAIGGASFHNASAQRRDIPGLHIAGSGPGVVITGGQHANETSGVVGALRAAPLLKASGVNFALVPQDNPDGYALHHRLREENPRHMLHAARYTALGDDLDSRTAPPWYEKSARIEAARRTGARLHLNLHGYPAHEWTRPLCGYLPRGFELWTIPKGFFLILRHYPGLGAKATSFLEALTARLIQSDALRAYNESQLAAYRTHAGPVPFPVLNSIPCTIVESDRGIVPFTIITEYPDETIYGDAFRLAHTTQMQTVLAAVELYLDGALG